jgi:hypothetical protein
MGGGSWPSWRLSGRRARVWEAGHDGRLGVRVEVGIGHRPRGMGGGRGGHLGIAPMGLGAEHRDRCSDRWGVGTVVRWVLGVT